MAARFLHPCLHSQGCSAGLSGAGGAVWGGLCCPRGAVGSRDSVADAAAVFGSSTTTRTPGIMDSITTQPDPGGSGVHCAAVSTKMELKKKNYIFLILGCEGTVVPPAFGPLHVNRAAAHRVCVKQDSCAGN